MTTIDEAEAAARCLRQALAGEGTAITEARSLELVSLQLGHPDWDTARARLRRASRMGPGVPVLRVSDGQRARDFYADGLGFELLWEHRFAPELPLYQRLGRAETVLDLSEHLGDGSPGSVVWVPVADVRALHAEFRSGPAAHRCTDVDEHAPGGPTLEVTDPFGNTLRFCRPDPD